MIFIIPIIFIFIVLLTLVLILKSERVLTFINKNKTKIEVSSTLVSFLTIVSIAIAMGALLTELRVRAENMRVIVENSAEEIERDLELIQGIEEQFAVYKSSFDLPTYRFVYNDLDKVMNADIKIETRRNISLATAKMQRVNQMIDRLFGTGIFLIPNEGAGTYVTIKNNNWDTIRGLNGQIKSLLLLVKSKLDK